MKTFETFIDCIPPTTTAQQHKRIFRTRDGRAFLGTDAKGNRVQAELCALLAAHVPGAEFPRDVPARVEIEFAFPYRKSERKRVVREGRVIPHASRPDVDNLVKFLLDCMTRTRFWNDDGQVFALSLRKVWSPKPGIAIRIDYVESEDSSVVDGGLDLGEIFRQPGSL